MGVNRQQFLDKFLNNDNPVQVYPAEVVAVNSQTCTVRLLASGLEVEDVRLWADVDATDIARFVPRIGSTVLVGCVENDVANLYVAQFAEVDGFDLTIGKMRVSVDESRVLVMADKNAVSVDERTVEIQQAGTKIELQGGKVSITNGAVSLKDVFDDLSSLIQNLKVITAQGPSTALFPDTIVALTAFKAKYPLLLS